MKMILLMLAFLVSAQAQASWEKIIDCNGGELVVDQGEDESIGQPTFQLVLRGEPLEYFLEEDAIDERRVNDAGEFVTWLNSYDGQLMGFIGHDSPGTGHHSYRYYWVYRNGSEVTLRSTVGDRLRGETERASWQFRDCR